MCGLFGFIGIVPAQKGIMVAIAEQAGRRGPQAWGISWYRKHLMMGVHFPASLKDDLGRFASIFPPDAAIIGQTRLCTSGDYHDTWNNQPITIGSGHAQISIAHNGIVYNADVLVKKHDVRLTTENDSEIIAHLITRGEGSLLERTVHAIGEIDGRSPLALLVLSPEGIVLARRGHPLYILDIAGSTYICSRPFYPIFEYMLPDSQALFIPNPISALDRDMRRHQMQLPPPVRMGW